MHQQVHRNENKLAAEHLGLGRDEFQYDANGRPSKRQMDVWQGALRTSGLPASRSRQLRQEAEQFLSDLILRCGMFNELTFEEGEVDLRKPYLGGGAHLPGSTSWPLDRQGNPKLHLACFPLAFITEYSDFKVDAPKLVSIFLPYSKSSDDYICEVMDEGGEVLIYSPGEQLVHSAGEAILPPKLIVVVENQGEDSDENGIAKIGGIPCWLQDEEFRGELSFALQINSSRLNKAAPSHKGILVGGIGVLLLREREGEVEGRFIVQTT